MVLRAGVGCKHIVFGHCLRVWVTRRWGGWRPDLTFYANFFQILLFCKSEGETNRPSGVLIIEVLNPNVTLTKSQPSGAAGARIACGVIK